MRILVIVNVTSGGGDAGLYDFVRELGFEGAEVVMRFAGPSARIEGLLDDAEEFDRVVAAGGDGTVTAVCYATRDSGIPVLAYPAGTANLLSQNLGLPLDAPALAAITLEGAAGTFDIGELELPASDPDGEPRRSGFMVMAGAGYDAAIMQSAQPLKPAFGAMAYLMAAVGNLTPTPAEFELVLDGEHVSTDGIAVLVVNFGRIQFELSVAKGSDPADGMLDVVVLRSKNAAGLIPAVFSAIADRIVELPASAPGLDVYQASRVEVSSYPPLAMQYDGEVLDRLTPFCAVALRGAGTLLLPSERA